MRTRARTFTTPTQAMEAAAEVLKQHLPLIPGQRFNAKQVIAGIYERVREGTDSLQLELDRCWSVGCGLSISLRPSEVEREEAQEDRPGLIIYRRRPEVRISWSGTGRSPSEALASIALYRQVTELAALVDAALSRLEIAEVRDLPATAAAK